MSDTPTPRGPGRPRVRQEVRVAFAPDDLRVAHERLGYPWSCEACSPHHADDHADDLVREFSPIS